MREKWGVWDHVKVYWWWGFWTGRLGWGVGLWGIRMYEAWEVLGIGFLLSDFVIDSGAYIVEGRWEEICLTAF